VGEQKGGALRAIEEVSEVALKSHFDSAEVDSLAHYLFRFQPVRFGRAALASISLPKLVGNFSNISGCGIVSELRRNNWLGSPRPILLSRHNVALNRSRRSYESICHTAPTQTTLIGLF
jgi:hypothetical protein